MKEPKSKLPFRAKGLAGWILDEKSTYVCEVKHDVDREYIVQACNNFPKAIELLQWLIDQDGNKYNGDNYTKINRFLKSLEE